MNRRLFLGGALSLAVVASSLSAVAASEVPILWGDGIHDDTSALQALLDGKPFRTSDGFCGVAVSGYVRNGVFLISDTLHCRGENITLIDCTFIMAGDTDRTAFRIYDDAYSSCVGYADV